jgi:hypothetical protein
MRGEEIYAKRFFGSALRIILRDKAINKNNTTVVTIKRYSRR